MTNVASCGTLGCGMRVDWQCTCHTPLPRRGALPRVELHWFRNGVAGKGHFQHCVLKELARLRQLVSEGIHARRKIENIKLKHFAENEKMKLK